MVATWCSRKSGASKMSCLPLADTMFIVFSLTPANARNVPATQL